MSLWRTVSKISSPANETRSAFIGKRQSVADAPQLLGSLGIRKASPQPLPLETEETSTFHRPALEAQPEASTSGRDAPGNETVLERLMYTLYKIRGEAVERHIKKKGRRYTYESEHDNLLLPLRVFAVDGKGAGTDQKWVDMYYKELQIELAAIRKMKEDTVKAVNDTMKRGAGSNLSSSKTLISMWTEPLTKAIQEEQKLILNNVTGAKDRGAYGPHLLLLPAHVLANTALHGFITVALLSKQLGIMKTALPVMEIGQGVQEQVEMDMMKAKAKRVNRQRLVLKKRLKNVEGELQASGDEWSAEWFREWRSRLLKDPEYANMDEQIIQEELRQRIKEVKPYELPDPAAQDPAYPLGSSLIAETKSHGKELLVGTQTRLEKAVQRNAQRSSSSQLASLNRFLNRARQASRTWTQDRLAKVGSKLVELMMECCFIERKVPESGEVVKVPALYHTIVTQNNRKQGFIRLHEDAIRQLSRLKEVRALSLPAYQPMIIPPMPWRGVDYGGYLITRASVMRVRGPKVQKQALFEADRDCKLDKVYEALNALGETPWRINREMLAVIQHASSKKMEICDLPCYHDVPITPPPKKAMFRTTGGGFWKRPRDVRADREMDMVWAEALHVEESGGGGLPSVNEEGLLVTQHDMDDGSNIFRRASRRKGSFQRTQMLVTMTKEETGLERKMRRMSNSQIRKGNREQYSLRCDLKYKLKVAQKFKDKKAFYFPHNLDFRGRAYPMHPHLHHLGSDLCRGLLQFADGKPLGREGFKWLTVQIANTWGHGVDKLSMDERRQFVADNQQNIQESVGSPFENIWWQGAEEPWQFLAACQDMVKALSSDNVETYVSHMPVMMDGSCNGLQHYAALGLDLPGGRSVNLLPVDKPQDVYSEVAHMVRERVRGEAEYGLELAQLLLSEIDRKLVKQTVMTSVYGVTFIGARQQITNRLRERGYLGSRSADAYQVANYAAKQTLAGLHERFGQAKLVMEWLSESARAICKVDQPVMWTTPLGLPVVQPYRKQVKVPVTTSLQRLILVRDGKRNEIMRARQRTAFPPNFIHSIDSTHMMMTAIACRQAGLAFAGVHDSFWTHAADVPDLNRILREKFVELYKKPLLENLAAQFRKQYPDAELPPLPEKGELDIEQVLEAPYFFS